MAVVRIRVVATFWGSSDSMIELTPIVASVPGSNFLSAENYLSGPRVPSVYGLAGPNDGPVDESFVFVAPSELTSAESLAIRFLYGYEPYEIHVALSDDGITFGPENMGVVDTVDPSSGYWEAIVPLSPAPAIVPFWTDYNRTFERR